MDVTSESFGRVALYCLKNRIYPVGDFLGGSTVVLGITTIHFQNEEENGLGNMIYTFLWLGKHLLDQFFLFRGDAFPSYRFLLGCRFPLGDKSLLSYRFLLSCRFLLGSRFGLHGGFSPCPSSSSRGSLCEIWCGQEGTRLKVRHKKSRRDCRACSEEGRGSEPSGEADTNEREHRWAGSPGAALTPRYVNEREKKKRIYERQVRKRVTSYLLLFG